MLKEIDNWLTDINRKYALGLSIFLALATLEIKAKYAEYLSSGDTNDVSPTDPRFPMLINKVTDIYNKVRANPDAYKDAPAFNAVKIPVYDTQEQIKQIIALKEEKDEMQGQLEELDEANTEKADEIKQLHTDIEDKDNEIDKLKTALRNKGINLKDESDLPKSVKLKYDRIKVLIPLMAKIHAELSDVTLTDEQRKAVATELCDLDDERRALWDDIDAYLDNYEVVFSVDRKLEFSDNPLIRGTQIANRIKRLEENIRRNKEAIETHTTNGKPNLVDKAKKKADAYQVELDQLYAMLNETN